MFKVFPRTRIVSIIIRSVEMSSAAGRPPNLSNKSIIKLLKETFPFKHINDGTIKALPSYDDRNYYFKGELEHPQLEENLKASCSDSTSSAACSQEQEYVLKVNNPVFASFDVLKGINVILRRLCAKGFSCIRPLCSRNNSDAIEVEGKELLKFGDLEEEGADIPEATKTNKFVVRVMTFIPGEMFDEIEKRFVTPKLLYEVGKYIGRVCEEIQVLFLVLQCKTTYSVCLIISTDLCGSMRLAMV